MDVLELEKKLCNLICQNLFRMVVQIFWSFTWKS